MVTDRRTFRWRIFGTFFLVTCAAFTAAQEDISLVADAEACLHKAVAFFRTEVSTEGGYLWRYSADLSRREGEGKATDTQAWVQPPGTPSVGLAFLDAYEKTGDRYYLDAAVETAHALVRGQLRSGGWDYRIEFDPEKRKKYAYRDGGATEGVNISTLDDNTTQAALRCLVKVDRALDFKDAAVHEAVLYGLDCLLKAQYPNGAWPQRYNRFLDPADYPVMPAKYPETWSRTYVKRAYTADCTLNDNVLADAVKLMWLANEVYGDKRYKESALRAGEFLLLAQMPEPQPAWAQQYNAEMEPVWARKFEPPAVTGGESQQVMRVLLDFYQETNDVRYLHSVGRALEYFKKSRLSDGGLARFYELKTNKPLYFTKAYELTYSDADMPTHYGFKIGWGLQSVEADYRAAKDGKPMPSYKKKTASQQSVSAQEVKAIVKALDGRGAWVEKGRLLAQGENDATWEVISCQTFIENVRILAGFIAASKE